MNTKWLLACAIAAFGIGLGAALPARASTSCENFCLTQRNDCTRAHGGASSCERNYSSCMFHCLTLNPYPS